MHVPVGVRARCHCVHARALTCVEQEGEEQNEKERCLHIFLSAHTVSCLQRSRQDSDWRLLLPSSGRACYPSSCSNPVSSSTERKWIRASCEAVQIAYRSLSARQDCTGRLMKQAGYGLHCQEMASVPLQICTSIYDRD